MTGINYQNFRLNENADCGFSTKDGQRRLSYIGLPLLYSFKPLESIPLRMALGGYFNVLVSAREKCKVSMKHSNFNPSVDDPIIMAYPLEYDHDIRDNLNYIDLGLSGRLTYLIPLNHKFSIGVFTEFNMGLSNMNGENDYYSWNNYSLLIGTGLQF